MCFAEFFEQVMFHYKRLYAGAVKKAIPEVLLAVFCNSVDGFSRFRLERSDKQVSVPEESQKIRFFASSRNWGIFAGSVLKHMTDKNARWRSRREKGCF